MHPLNVLYLGFLLFCVIRGIVKGIATEGFTIAAVYCGFYLASVFYRYPAAIVVRVCKRETVFNRIGFFSIFFCIVLLFSIGGLIAAYVYYGKDTVTGGRVCGGGLSLVKGMLIICVVIIALISLFPNTLVQLKA